MTGVAVLVRDRARRALLRRARDATAMVGGRRALVVAPHPDDETLGCGARILLSRGAGVDVTVVVATTGSGSHDSTSAEPTEVSRMRRSELAAAARRLRVPADRIVELGYPDGGLADHVPALTADLRRILAERQPQDVYVTCAAERHPDHAAAARAVGQALDGYPSEVRLLEYPIWLWADWPLSRRYVDGRGIAQLVRILIRRSVESVDVASVRAEKRHALEAYESQLGGDADPARAVQLPDAVVRRAIDGPELFLVVRRARGRT